MQTLNSLLNQRPNKSPVLPDMPQFYPIKSPVTCLSSLTPLTQFKNQEVGHIRSFVSPPIPSPYSGEKPCASSLPPFPSWWSGIVITANGLQANFLKHKAGRKPSSDSLTSLQAFQVVFMRLCGLPQWDNCLSKRLRSGKLIVDPIYYFVCRLELGWWRKRDTWHSRLIKSI